MKTGPHQDWSERIKLERTKRSWTQDHLAEMAKLSTRTIQRLENGAEPSLETIRALADAFGIEVEVLRGFAIRKDYSSPWDKQLKIMTAVVCAILIAGTIFVPGIYAFIPVALLICCLFLGVQGYSLRDGQLLIHRLGWSTRYPLSEITELTVNPQAMVGSIRVFGIGGLFGYIGYFRNTILGKYLAFVTDRSKCLVVGLGEKRIVISPDAPEEMRAAIEQVMKAT
jgi:transcriptional regulator with XRE-family HTH domain